MPMKLQKHERAVIEAIEALDIRVEVLRGKAKHRKMQLTLPSGTVRIIGMASSPTNSDFTLKAAMRQVHALLKEDSA